MNDAQRYDLSKAPEWLEGDLREAEKVPLWACTGTCDYGRGTMPRHRRWIYMFRSKEEAEAEATIPLKGWTWDKGPAEVFSLAETMLEARQLGYAGVALKAYVGRKWVALKMWPAGVPLSKEDLAR